MTNEDSTAVGTPRIAFVLKGYPRLSETFIAQEIRALEKAGLPLLLVSLRHPTESARHPVHEEVVADVLYLPEYLHREPWRVIAGWWHSRRHPGFWPALRLWLADLKRDRTRNRIRRFGQALVLAAELPADVDLLHAHFLHTPASVTRYAAVMLGRGWTCSAHARDIWTSPSWEKSEKLASCDWCVTCTKVNVQHLKSLSDHPERISLLYHGLDLARFGPYRRAAAVADGHPTYRPVRILSVGRAVEKKGYDVLLRALAKLPTELNWRFDHVGGGADAAALRELAEQLSLSPRITWHGALTQQEIIQWYRNADIFVLASKTASDGDQDGLPNVLMEAQSQGLACIATQISAVPELIDDGATGILVPPGDFAALADALSRLIQEPGLREALGTAGETKVRSEFSFEPGMARLAERFERTRAGTSRLMEQEPARSSARSGRGSERPADGLR